MHSPINISFNPALVTASFIISGLGCHTAFELIHVKSFRKGTESTMLLFLSGIVLGGTGTAASALLSILSLQLSHTQEMKDSFPALYLTYIPYLGLYTTTLSLILGLICVYKQFNISNQAPFLWVSLSSVIFLVLNVVTNRFALWGVLGNPGVMHKKIEWNKSYVVFLTLLAYILEYFGIITSMLLIQWLIIKWRLVWWIRAICGWWLAFFICGARYLSWSVVSFSISVQENFNPILPEKSSLEIILCVIITTVMGVLAMVAAILSQLHVKKKEAEVLQNISIGFLYFNLEGKLLVSSTGSLPMAPVEVEHDGMASFSVKSPPFLWILRASWCWKEVSQIMLPDLYEFSVQKTAFSIKGKEENFTLKESLDKDVAFCKATIRAIHQLSESMGMTLAEAGIAWEKPLLTENPSNTGSVGWCIILTKQLDFQASNRCVNSGFRWVEMHVILPSLQEKYSSNSDIASVLKDARDYSMIELNELRKPLPKGVYAVCVMGKPSLDGLKILVRSDQRHMVPYKLLSEVNWDPDDINHEDFTWIQDLVYSKDTVTLKDVYDLALRVSTGEKHAHFELQTAIKMVEFIETLMKSMPEARNCVLIQPEKREVNLSEVQGLCMDKLFHRIHDFSSVFVQGVLGKKKVHIATGNIYDLLLFSTTLSLHETNYMLESIVATLAPSNKYRFYPLYNFECGHYFFMTPTSYRETLEKNMKFDLPYENNLSEYLRQDLGMICPGQYEDDISTLAPTQISCSMHCESKIEQGLKRFYQEWKEFRWFYFGLCGGSFDAGVNMNKEN